MNPNALLRFPRALVSRARMPLRKARRRLADRASIERYLAGHRPACLHLGCGVHPLSGWLNSDLEPNDPAVYVSAVPNYAEGETFLLGKGHRLRILRIDTDIDDGLDITASSDAAYSGDGCGL